MNTNSLRLFALGSLLSVPLIGGCNPGGANASSASTNAMGTDVAGAKLVAGAGTPASPKPDATTNAPAHEPQQPEVPFVAERPIPPSLNPSASLREVIKLSQAGVDDTILLSFVNNCTSAFMVGADEIIYLNDIGVPTEVINSILERDKTVRTGGAASPGQVHSQPQSAMTATQALAVAPSYVQPPAPEESQPVPQPVEVNVTENHFYESLSPYGSWVEVDGYGRCWQPSVVVANRHWRPYVDGGRWMYTDAGWYWYSDYSWGWAPFHYGRWFNSPRWGWCWTPGYTWGPAWVSWSYTDSYCGWAPLPPAAVYTGSGFTYYGSYVSSGFSFGLGYSSYSYVSWGNFCNYRPAYHCVPENQCSQIYNNSTCHSDYSTDAHKRIINRGPPPERVEQHAKTPVRRTALRDVVVDRPPTSTTRGETLSRDGRTLEVRRPVSRSTVAATPATQSSTDTRTVPARADRKAADHAGQNIETRGAVSHDTLRTDLSQQPLAANEPAQRPTRRMPGEPLIIRGNGGAVPQVTGYVVPTTHSPQRTEQPPTDPAPEQTLADANPTPTPAAPTHRWTPPNRNDDAVQQPRSQVIRVGRSIENRPSGSPNYRVYSSPQPQQQPQFETPPVQQQPSRPVASHKMIRQDDDASQNNYEAARAQAREQARQVERRQEQPAPQRPEVQRPEPQRPQRVEAPRPAPAPSRSESRSSESTGNSSRPRK
jgi:hypothetical protein